MTSVIRYMCDECGELFTTEEHCAEHEDRHRRINKANEMLKSGSTLQEIQKECNIWYKLPEYLKDITQDNCFIISYWQCCYKPAYQIKSIEMSGKLNIYGIGSWTGYYGNEVPITSNDLRNPRPKEELFIDNRYFEKC